MTLAALLGAIALATAFLNTLITMNITGRRKKRKREADGDMTLPMAIPFVGEMLRDVFNTGET